MNRISWQLTFILLLGAGNKPSTEYLLCVTDIFTGGRGPPLVHHVPVRLTCIFPPLKESRVVQTWCEMAADRPSVRSPGGNVTNLRANVLCKEKCRITLPGSSQLLPCCVGDPIFLRLYFLQERHLCFIFHNFFFFLRKVYQLPIWFPNFFFFSLLILNLVSHRANLFLPNILTSAHSVPLQLDCSSQFYLSKF